MAERLPVVADHVLAVHANAALTPALRFAAQRLVDLCAEGAHFSQSASFTVDPLTAVREMAATRREFKADRGMHFPEMLNACKNLKWLLEQDPLVRSWFRQPYLALIPELGRIVAVPDGLAQAAAAEDASQPDPAAKEQAVRSAVDKAFRRRLDDLLRRMNRERDGYKARLVEKLEADLTAFPTHDHLGWRSIDETLRHLAALTIAEGRSAEGLATGVCSSLVKATSAVNGVRRTCDAFVVENQSYVVAFALIGANHVSGSAAFGCQPVPVPCVWPGDHAVRPVLLRRLHRDQCAGIRATAFSVDIAAPDPITASDRAMARAEALVDQLIAEKRGSRFRIAADTVVLDVARGKEHRLATGRAGVRRARPLTAAGIPELERALRYHSLARATNVPTGTVISGWVALEALGQGARLIDAQGHRGRMRSAGSFLPEHCAAAMSLTAIKHVLTGTWRVARAAFRVEDQPRFEQLEGWLGVRNGQEMIDLRRFMELVTADPASARPPAVLAASDPVEAAAAVLYEVEVGHPYVGWRLREARRLLSDPAQLVAWAENIRGRAQLNVDRIHALRNRAVHDAVYLSDGDRQIAAMTLHTLDAAFEVLRHWLPANGPAPWEALHAVRKRQTYLFKAWPDSDGGQPFDPRTIVEPAAGGSPAAP